MALANQFINEHIPSRQTEQCVRKNVQQLLQQVVTTFTGLISDISVEPKSNESHRENYREN